MTPSIQRKKKVWDCESSEIARVGDITKVDLLLKKKTVRKKQKQEIPGNQYKIKIVSEENSKIHLLLNDFFSWVSTTKVIDCAWQKKKK